MTQHLRTTCPFCGYHHDRITPASREEVLPENGDASMCWSCGEFCIIDNRSDLGMRKPTRIEQRLIDVDERVIHMRASWKRAKVKLQ